jgi:hypothetical protein
MVPLKGSGPFWPVLFLHTHTHTAPSLPYKISPNFCFLSVHIYKFYFVVCRLASEEYNFSISLDISWYEVSFYWPWKHIFNLYALLCASELFLHLSLIIQHSLTDTRFVFWYYTTAYTIPPMCCWILLASALNFLQLWNQKSFTRWNFRFWLKLRL